MSKYLRPDGCSKSTRYRISLARANGIVRYYYSNVRDRHKSRLHTDLRTGKVLPLNAQFKIRFHGALHFAWDHGPKNAAARWRVANYRFNQGAPVRGFIRSSTRRDYL